ncbi:Gamma-butyrobetaine dioxygenase [Rhizoctonia solani AG-1 IB]|uniref:Gamma-butyrobetaine dioxygenase n=1 Tax=Thanatephorus cucumeris (strain AG1-IB / isolate 7/3/14) TaxID=1108050 RepID=M5CDR5_THACB|nr:Gamma-butyrobetaine dioxygenase [Rhizoctonia solani AG-1 IB]
MIRLPVLRSMRPCPKLSRALATVQHSSGLLFLTHDKNSLQLSGSQLTRPLSLPYAWLRDSCQCPRCVHPSTKQKLARTGDFLSSAPRSISLQSEGLAVSWAGDSEKDSVHESQYPLSFLQRYAEPTGQSLHVSHFDNLLNRRPWDLSTLPAPLFIQYEDFLKDPLPGFVRTLRDGFMLLRGVPTEHTEYGHTAPSAVEPLAHMFGIVRETMYGRLWDVVSKKASTNIAFTNLKLDLHMDLMYLEHPPHIQFLHCIKTQVKGGSSVFVDALKAAQDLWYQDRGAFDLLASTPIPFHYENDGHHLHHSHTTIQLAPDQARTTNGPPEILNINYCPPFQAPLPINTPLSVYSALGKFAELLSRPEARLEQLLEPGDCAVFDNRRVLHARTAFWDERAKEGDEQETNRWLKGCYVERDEVLNRARGMLAAREGSCDYA